MLKRVKKISFATLLAAMTTAGSTAVVHAGQTLTVYKSPTCGCCEAWADRMEDAGFKVVAHNTHDMRSVKHEHGVGQALASCHTALIDGYVIEGHVPAKEIQKLLENKYDVAGLTVPGMPVGSPGMEMGGRQDAYNVLVFKGSKAGVFASY